MVSGQKSVHIPVMPREVLHQLQLSPGLSVLDGTAGGGGHSALILKHISPGGRLVSIDRDATMLELAAERLRNEFPTQSNYQLYHGSYTRAAEFLSAAGLEHADRVLLDLGLSSDQLADRERGFGFDAGGPLDMRFHAAGTPTAATLLRISSEAELVRMMEDYGDEPSAKKIAAEIIQRRSRGQSIETTAQLEDCVQAATGQRRGAGRNPATRVFQALRIATNNELQHVEQMMTEVLPRILKTGGIAVILTFHSLEDRIVKNACKGHQGWQVLTKTPLEPTPAEVRLNPRSRSTKLRAVRKL
ncbi:MAG: 16S rRNA (cytosine(1402)-N(4))-methyltransferase RsmH [Planctomycetaceae bacterium]|nr:16S rRNA (cytosine(1402)-N(4))-methyltransferase RsmH [Planctomycetaceae bacterium]